MAKVSISEAARLAGISRQHLYKKWITPGLLTVEKDGENPPAIDTSELLRAFGELKGGVSQGDRRGGDMVQEAEYILLQAELQATRQRLADCEAQLREAGDREEWLKTHIGEMTGALRLLENRAKTEVLEDQVKKARQMIVKYKEALETEREALAAERSRGFWARLFGQ